MCLTKAPSHADTLSQKGRYCRRQRLTKIPSLPLTLPRINDPKLSPLKQDVAAVMVCFPQ